MGEEAAGSARPPRVSVIVTTYNHGRFLGEALDSVDRQTYGDREVVVVDDGSTDGTAERFASRPGIRLVSQPNGGVASARNHGLRITGGELVAFLDADDVWLPDKLARQVEWLDAHPEADAVAVEQTLWFPAAGTERVQPNPPLAAIGWDDFFYQRLNLQSPTAVLFRRAALDRVGRFDDSVRFADDLDLYLRLTETRPIGRIAEPLVRCRIQDNSTSRHLARTLAIILGVLERARARRAGGAPPTAAERAYFARRQRDLAYACLWTRAPGALRAALASLRLEPFAPKGWLYALAGLAPPVYRALRRALRGGEEPQLWFAP